jgi:tetratricopeptide (TPR) repeat protein
MGRIDEAVAQSKRAQELDPLSPGISRRLGLTLFHARRYDEAIPQFLRALDLNPGYAMAYEDLGDAYEQKKNVRRSRRCVAQGDDALRK